MDEFGQVIMVYPEEGDFEKGMKAVMRQIVVANGLPLNDLAEKILDKLAREEAEKIKRHTKRGGIPNDLRILLGLREKKKVVAWIKKMTISMGCIANLILNCNKIGFSHRRIHKEFISEDTNQSIENKIRFVNKTGEAILNDEEETLKQLISRYQNRKYSTAHLFEKGHEWHLFYFDHNDIYIPAGANHHFQGPHVHYVSHLWGRNINKERLWNQFDNREIKTKSVHIRFIEEEMREPKNEKGKGKVRLGRIKPQNVMKLDDKTVCYRDDEAGLAFRVYRKNQD